MTSRETSEVMFASLWTGRKAGKKDRRRELSLAKASPLMRPAHRLSKRAEPLTVESGTSYALLKSTDFKKRWVFNIDRMV